MYFHKEAEQSSISGVNCDLLEHLCSWPSWSLSQELVFCYLGFVALEIALFQPCNNVRSNGSSNSYWKLNAFITINKSQQELQSKMSM